MSLSNLADVWCNLAPHARILIMTDEGQHGLAKELQHSLGRECSVIAYGAAPGYEDLMARLEPQDLVVALFSLEAFVQKGANRFFSPFRKPRGVQAKYAFIRLDISKESLEQGLATPVEVVYQKIAELGRFPDGARLRVTSDAGTDLALQIHAFTTCEHRIVADGGMAFLPPSETSSAAIPYTANGRIVIDVTVGQLYHYGTLLGVFGLVDAPVTLEVRQGEVTEITGGSMAAELKRQLFALSAPCRALVELGHGLSMMAPTGLIGVDESIIDTCHFGFGEAAACGVHLDLVLCSPRIVERTR